MRALALLLLFAVATATASMPASTYTNTEGSSCWECHADGLWNPPMRGPEFQQGRFVQDGDQWILEVDVHNPWAHDLVHVGATLSPAPQGIAPMGEPIVTTASGTANPTFQEQMVVHEISIAPETQSFEVNVDVSSLTPSQWSMQLVPRESSAEQWDQIVDGDTAVVSEADLAASGEEVWDLTLFFDPSLSTQVDYQIHEAQHVSSGTAWRSSDASTTPNGTATIQWPLNITQDLGETSLLMTVYAQAYYEHEDPVDDDDAWLIASEEILIAVDNGTPYFVEALEAEREAQEAEDEFVPGMSSVAAIAGLAMLALARRHQ